METISCNIPNDVKVKVPTLVGLDTKQEATIVNVNGVEVGGSEVVIIAGPCAVESEEQIFETARSVSTNGARIIRGGAYKPRSSPYSFQGMEEEGLRLLREISKETGVPVVTEVMDTKQVGLVSEYADLVQVGSRNMQNFPLLKEVGMCGKPVLLKRGMMATIEEFLNAAEYILHHGNDQVILCERGLRTFETSTRNTLDLSAVPMLKHLSHLPVIVDPSHGTGHRWMIAPMSKAAIAAGADGIMMEVHYKPEIALCDGHQSLTLELFDELMIDLRKVAGAVGKTIS